MFLYSGEMTCCIARYALHVVLSRLQLRALPNPLNPHLPHTTIGIRIGNSVQFQKRLPFRSFGAISHGSSFAITKSVKSVNGFGFPFPGNGIGRSLLFSSRAADTKQKKKTKALAVRTKDKDVSSSECVPEGVNNVASGKSLGEGAASDKQDTEVAAKKKKKPSSSRSKKDSKASVSNSSEEVAGEEVSRKSSPKGKKKTKTTSKESSSVSTPEATPDDLASARHQLKKKTGKSSQDEQKPPWKFTHKPLYPPSGKSVVVVESVTKAKVIQGYLGDVYEVLPSYGHVRDLAARSGSVRPDDDFSLVWEVPSPAWTHLKSIKVALSGAENIILASDPDREGEAIAWHIIEMLQQQGALHDNISVARVVFHEITEQSIKGALQSPREIDVNLVHAYLARRALDYLIGFNISPLLWRKLPGCQSAGRVQSAALSLICDRELEIDEFKPKEYWTVEAQFMKIGPRSNKDLTFPAHLTHFDSEKLSQFSITSDTEAGDIKNKINSANFQVISLKRNKIRRNPPTPYITSTLQQDAANKLHFTASHTMKLAQKLYEGVELSDGVAAGLITYIRTDGFHISDEAVANIRSLIIERESQSLVSRTEGGGGKAKRSGVLFCSLWWWRFLAVYILERKGWRQRFELPSGLTLKIIMSKNGLAGINKDPQTLSFASFQDPVVKKISNCLDNWKEALFLPPGQITLIQACLSSIPLYYLSLLGV
ncbi:TOPRIM domain [Sesbania bispinosa]|nr:TOPRIM domain [Sesbania bispinosa]